MTENLNPHYVVRPDGMRNADYDRTGYDSPADLEHARSIAAAKASRDSRVWLVLHDHGGDHFERHVVARFSRASSSATVDSECTHPPLPSRGERVPLDAPLAHGHRHGPLPTGVEPVPAAVAERLDAALRDELDRRFVIAADPPVTSAVAIAEGRAEPVSPKVGRCWHGNLAALCVLGHTAKDWAEFMALAGPVDPS